MTSTAISTNTTQGISKMNTSVPSVLSYHQTTLKRLRDIVGKTTKNQSLEEKETETEIKLETTVTGTSTSTSNNHQASISDIINDQHHVNVHCLPRFLSSSRSSSARNDSNNRASNSTTIPFLPNLTVDTNHNHHNMMSTSPLPQPPPPPLLPPSYERTNNTSSTISNLRNFCRGQRFGNVNYMEQPPSSQPLQDNNTHNSMNHLGQDLMEQIIYERAATLTNSRPESSFAVYTRRNNTKNTSNIKSNEDDDDPSTTLFDGAVANGTPVANSLIRGLGGGSGTIQHLACALDSPFGLALVLTLGADVSSRHTAFRRLIVHEAACCDSPECLGLLLELGRNVNVTSISGCKKSGGSGGGGGVCQQEDQVSGYDDFHYPVKRQKSNICLLDLAKEDKIVQNNQNDRMSYASFLDYALELVGQLKSDKISEMDAARLLLSKGTLSDANRAIISVICKVDEHQEVSLNNVLPNLLTYARITNVDGHGNTSLHWAAFKNAASCVKLLLDFGANPNAVAESTGWTPLHDAAYSDSADSIYILVKAHANVNSKAHSGATPLCFAAQEDSPNAARLLLEAGADATIRCCESGVTNSENSTAHAQQNIHNSRFSGYTPLHYCAHYNSCRAAVVLLEHHAKVKNQSKSLFNIQDLNNKLPIHIVAERGSSDVLRELLHHGVEVDCGRNETTDSAIGEPENQESLHVTSDEASARMATADLVAPSSPNTRMQSTVHVITPISSPILRSLIPTVPVNSSKPWNCLSQNAIDECRYLLKEAELCWSPSRHYIFTPSDRVSVFELLRVGVRLNHIPREMWLFILDFCGRGWFNPNSKNVYDQKNVVVQSHCE